MISARERFTDTTGNIAACIGLISDTHFGASIAGESLRARWPWLHPVVERHECLPILRRAASPCWDGEKERYDEEDLLRELRAEGDLPPELLAEFETALTESPMKE